MKQRLLQFSVMVLIGTAVVCGLGWAGTPSTEIPSTPMPTPEAHALPREIVPGKPGMPGTVASLSMNITAGTTGTRTGPGTAGSVVAVSGLSSHYTVPSLTGQVSRTMMNSGLNSANSLPTGRFRHANINGSIVSSGTYNRYPDGYGGYNWSWAANTAVNLSNSGTQAQNIAVNRGGQINGLTIGNNGGNTLTVNGSYDPLSPNASSSGTLALTGIINLATNTATSTSNYLNVADASGQTIAATINVGQGTVNVAANNTIGGTITTQNGTNYWRFAGTLDGSLSGGGTTNYFEFNSATLRTGSNVSASGTTAEIIIGGGSSAATISSSATTSRLDISNATVTGAISATGTTNQIRVAGGSNSSNITATGSSNTVYITSGTFTAGNINLTGSTRNQIRIDTGSFTSRNITASGTGSNSIIDINGGSFTGTANITATSSGSNEISIATGTFGDQTIRAAGTNGTITIGTGTTVNGGSITANGSNLNQIGITNATIGNITASSIITAGVTGRVAITGSGVSNSAISMNGSGVQHLGIINSSLTNSSITTRGTNGLIELQNDVISGTSPIHMAGTGTNQLKLDNVSINVGASPITIDGTNSIVTIEGGTNNILAGGAITINSTNDNKMLIKDMAITGSAVTVKGVSTALVFDTDTVTNSPIAANGTSTNEILFKDSTLTGSAVSATGAVSNTIHVQNSTFNATSGITMAATTNTTAENKLLIEEGTFHAITGYGKSNVLDIRGQAFAIGSTPLPLPATAPTFNGAIATSGADGDSFRIRAGNFVGTSSITASGGTNGGRNHFDVADTYDSDGLGGGTGALVYRPDFASGFAITSSASNSDFRLTGGYFHGGSEITANGVNSTNHIYISGTTRFDEHTSGTTITTTAATAISRVLMENMSNHFDTTMELNSAGENTLYLGTQARYDDHAETKITGVAATDNTVVFNTVNRNSSYHVQGVVDLSGIATTGTGVGAGTTEVHIASGIIKRDDNSASIIGGSTAGTAVNYYVSGGVTTRINTNVADGHYVFSNGVYSPTDLQNSQTNNAQVYNIHGAGPKETVNVDSSADYYGGDYMHYQLTNLGTIVIGHDDSSNGAHVTIGAIQGPHQDNNYAAQDLNQSYTDANGDVLNYDHQYAGSQAQITADHVYVANDEYNTIERKSKLMIHENYDNWDSPTTGTDSSNIINTLDIAKGGEVTIDRTSFKGDTAHNGKSTVTVWDGGTLYGFGVIEDDTDHSPVRANVEGTVTIESGGRIQPYDRTIFTDTNNVNNFYGADIRSDDPTDPNYEAARNRLKGVQFKVNGDMVFKKASILSTRLFHDKDGSNQVWVAGESQARDKYFSDSITATGNIDFSAIFNSNYSVDTDTSIDDTVRRFHKLQYDPVFGFNYELRSKQDFQIYEGNPNDDTQTYYYSVAYADVGTKIEELFSGASSATGNVLADANHLANRYILKSDMLGEWYFMPNVTGDELLLRYRMLVSHPTTGGIKKVMMSGSHRNEVTPGQYLDEIRYPFQGIWGSDITGEFNRDPSDDMTYLEEGYNGDMVYFYERASDPNNTDPSWHQFNPIYDNYREEWIRDFELLFHAIQLNGGAASFMHEMVRMLHAETYANMTETTLGMMQSFIQLRERNSISALFQVENDDWDRPKTRPYGIMYDPILDAGANDRFVQNPIRFWGSAFGQQGRKRQKYHDEFSYESAVWGGAVGMIKETGDMYHGLTIGYAYNQNKYDNYNHTSSTTNSHIAEALVGFRLFEWGFAELHGNYSYNKNKNNRVVHLESSDPLFTYSGVGMGDFKSHVAGGGLRFGWQQVLGENWLLVPTIGFNVMDYRAEAFEEGGRENMAVRLKFAKGAMDRTVYRIPLQVRLSRSIAFGGSVISPEIRAGYTPVLGNREAKAKAEWVGNPVSNRQFTSYGLNLGTYEAWVGGTLEWSRRGKYYIAGNYDYSFGSNSFNHNFSLQAGLNF